MSFLHNQNDPRYTRLFEFLRQHNTAQNTLRTRQKYKMRRVNKEEMDVIKRVAARSFSRPNNSIVQRSLKT